MRYSRYARDGTDGRSVSVGAVMLSGAAISWVSRTRRYVTLSITEAEHPSMGANVTDALFARDVWDFLQPHLSGQTIRLFEDSRCNSIGGNRDQLRAFKARLHQTPFLAREDASFGDISTSYTGSDEQHADTLTKPLGATLFVKHRRSLLSTYCSMDVGIGHQYVSHKNSVHFPSTVPASALPCAFITQQSGFRCW